MCKAFSETQAYPVGAGPSLSGKSYDATRLSPEDAWIGKLDFEGFRDEIRALDKELRAQQGPRDLAHLNKIVWWSRCAQWAGALTMWHSVNPISIFLLSIGHMTRWTCVSHHVCHGGYDKQDASKRYNRFTFGVGSLRRRVVDWLEGEPRGVDVDDHDGARTEL